MNRQNQQLPDPKSPFSNTDLKTITEPVIQEGRHLGIRLETGDILCNFNSNTNYAMLSLMAKHVHGEVVVVKGTWTFEAKEVVVSKNGH